MSQFARVKGERPITALAKIQLGANPVVAARNSQPRAIGTALVRTKQRATETVLDDFRLSGSCRVLFPRRQDKTLEAVLLNTSGGVTSGDRFDITAIASRGTSLTLTTQAAERAYKSVDGQPGRLNNTLTIQDGAQLDWLPQETIFFDGSSLARNLSIDIAASSRFLMVEPIVFGRTAMGETVRSATLTDRVDLRRDGRLIFADRISLTGDVQSHLDRPAIAGGARAMASILLAAPDAERHLEPLRDLLPPTCGVSLIRDGLLFARLLASDGHDLRAILNPVLRTLRGTDLPRTWML
ncbi:urease accessory protein UreD [Shimia abyssi]|uniref:Urease accessory protein UreD n=1 Tax=Shimia abyssi TaxID=1662395 RepID=A0A2P8FHJ5_9RHOB|nr:urease accessory protein UreD [Shimia abyssi]PSL21189.1 urease accessory protein [Shimia abyssi]